ncbi:MAG: nuclear transport factor 2 family protein [Pseudomonadota bacterium]|jgi:uncharacterized protein (TIGR02246 family)|nr:nuclear transport factor 2 family protein [Sphingomonas sp.]MDQ3478015.1 nuclear transport factor 2 family protein [Pseudomonadota bacterium]
MKNIALVAAIAALAGCSVGAPDQNQPQPDGEAVRTVDSDQARRELEAANAAYDRALVAGDAAALAKVYTDDFQIIDDDAAIHGKQQQIEFMTTKVDLLDAKADDVRVTMLGPDSALLTGRFTGRYRMDGKENDFTERYTSVWVRKHGEWKVKHEHASLLPKVGNMPAT